MHKVQKNFTHPFFSVFPYRPYEFLRNLLQSASCRVFTPLIKMKCEHCYTDYSDAAFCSHCGTLRVEKATFHPDEENEGEDEKPKRKGRNPLIVGVWAVAVGLIIYALVVFVILPRIDFEPSQEETIPEKSIPKVAVGPKFILYGKTIDNKDFDWKSLRGKYVLVAFTATWCGPCKAEIPGMLEAYKKYRDKGFEIVSVYIWQDGRSDDPVATVKQFVKDEKLPWIILSETLTVKSRQPPQGKVFDIQGVPTMLLVDKESNVLPVNPFGEGFQQELQKLFEK
jgi:thiol-disulfide isomerase/thioredoxin